MREKKSEQSSNASLERYVIPNLRNACRVLKLLRSHPGGLKASDLARMLGIPVTTTMRIAATLQIEGLVHKFEGRFGLGPALIHLGNAALAGTDIRKISLPLLQKLTLQTTETSHLAVPCNERSLIIAVQDSPHPLRAVSPAGFLTDLHSSSTGKIFLAHVFREQFPQFHTLEPPYKHTARTLTKRADLEREIAAILKHGYSVDNEECHKGVRCVAAPIFSSDGHVVAAIGITAAAVRLPEKQIPVIAAKVRAIAAEACRFSATLAQSKQIKDPALSPPMSKAEVLNRIKAEKVVALIRAEGPETLLDCARALSAGGLNAIELTMTTPGAIEMTAEVSRQLPGIMLGLGTVLDAETARKGVAAGARFIVTPGLRPDVIKSCREMGVPIFSGALTPTEIAAAADLGADIIKIFPAEFFGPAYIKSLRAVFPDLTNFYLPAGSPPRRLGIF